MPLYEYGCPVCDTHTDAFRTVDNRHDAPLCERCENPTALTISAVRGIVRFPAARGDAYVSPTTNRVIDTETKRRDDLARSNCRPYEGLEAEKKEAARFRAEEEKKQDAKLHENVAKAYHQLSPEKRKILREA